jgi:hypothetical protein
MRYVMSNQIVIPVLFALIGVGGFIVALRDYLLGRASENWPAVEAEILGVDIVVPRLGRRTLSPQIRYKYQVDGITLVGNRISFASIGRKLFESTAEEAVSPYRVTQRVSVRVSPSDPRRSVLEPGVRTSTYVLLLAFVACAAIGIALIMKSLPRILLP